MDGSLGLPGPVSISMAGVRKVIELGLEYYISSFNI